MFESAWHAQKVCCQVDSNSKAVDLGHLMHGWQVAGVSAAASAQVCQRLLGSLLRAAEAAGQPDQASAGSSLALTAMLAIVRATRECLMRQPAEQAAGTPILAGKGPEVLLTALKQQGSSSSTGGAAHAEASGEAPAEVQLALLAQLATFPAACSPLGQPDQERALRFLLHCIAQPAPGCSDDGAAAASRVATDALADMARQGHAQLLGRQALPALLQAAASGDGSDSLGGSESSTAGGWQGAGALAALHAMAACSKDLCRDVREALFGMLCSRLGPQQTGVS